MQANTVPEKELTVLYLDLQSAAGVCVHTGLCIGDLKDHPHSDTLLPLRPHFLIVPPPISLYQLGPITFKLPHIVKFHINLDVI